MAIRAVQNRTMWEKNFFSSVGSNVGIIVRRTMPEDAMPTIAVGVFGIIVVSDGEDDDKQQIADAHAVLW